MGHGWKGHVYPTLTYSLAFFSWSCLLLGAIREFISAGVSGFWYFHQNNM